MAGYRIDPLAPKPPYRQIAEIIKQRILSGRYPPDTRIPTESELVEAFEVARSTARRAVGALRDEGFVYTVPQRGTYVASAPGAVADQKPESSASRQSELPDRHAP